MSKRDFRRALVKLGYTQEQFAALMRKNPRTVRRWCTGETPIPHAIAELVTLKLEAQGL